MAGRGRGRGGAAVSFNIELLGFGRGEACPISATQPPPLFPPLENRPLPLVKDVENEYILVTQKDLITRMRSSPFHLKSANDIKGVQQYSDKNASTSFEKELPVLWNRMPTELRKLVTKRVVTSKSKSTLNAKKKKVDDPDAIFAKLEKKETTENEEARDGKEEEENPDKSDDERVEIEDDAEEEIDEEMDEGTDYASNYFDNGEGYLDEDDNLDEGEAAF